MAGKLDHFAPEFLSKGMIRVVVVACCTSSIVWLVSLLLHSLGLELVARCGCGR